MLAIALGLGSSLFWGLADFGGGLQSRRFPVIAVLLVSQAVGLAGIAVIVALSGEPAPPLADLWPAAAGGAGALLAPRIAGNLGLLAFIVVTRPRLDVPPAALPALAAVGVLDLAANALYAWGTTEGLLSVVAVLGSLYPVATVLLARGVLGERIRPIQGAGVAAALSGVALIA